MDSFKELLLILSVALLVCGETEKPTVTRTEIKVSRSLNPDDMQTLNVMTRDGSVAQLIVKKREPKSKTATKSPEVQSFFPRSIYTNWIPVSSVYLQPNLVRLETLVKNESGHSEPTKHTNNVIDSDRIPNVPKPVTVRSEDIYVKPSADKKRGRSIVHLDTDGIPVVHGVRVPDEESDKHQTWRNARVINGELFPYEDGYKPPAAVPIGELVYASQANPEKTGEEKGVGPFTKMDNFRRETAKKQIALGPFTVKDNKPEGASSNSKLIDYIKEINSQEAKRDFFANRKYRSYEVQTVPPMQRRMLQYHGNVHYPNSLTYSPITTKLSPITLNEGSRTPVLQYAHPELGVQPAKASEEEDEKKTDRYETNHGRKSQNSIEYYKKEPFNTYYVQPRPEQPLWFRITESIKDNVQTGIQRMQQLTKPVFEPLVEATHKISHNLGFSQAPAQEKVGFVAPVGTSVILPALGLVAGGAALGFGAAAVGRYLSAEDMRSLHGLRPNDILVIMEEPRAEEEAAQHRRFRRSLLQNEDYYMQHLGPQPDNKYAHLTAPHFWSDTPCAKRLFCDVMTQQDPDEVVLMEKKMDSLLARVHPSVAKNVVYHLEEVMNAVKAKGCERFRCARKFFISPAA